MSDNSSIEKATEIKTELAPIDDSIKDLSLANINDIIDQNGRFLQIFSRAGDPTSKSLVEFHTLTDESLNQIVEKMPEINRATKAFGKQNSQVTGRLMSLTMLGTSAFHRMKQCLAKIERKRGALKENIYRLRKDKIALERLIDKRDSLKEELNKILNPKEVEPNPLEGNYDTTAVSTHRIDIDVRVKELNWSLQEIEIDIEEKVAGISDSNIYVEAALKEIGHYQTAYEQIMKNCQIPEDWNEKDFEEAEVEEHVKMAFLHAVRDVSMTGRLNVGTHEYLEQFGILPHAAFKLVSAYLQDIDKKVAANQVPSINSLYDFLDQMYDNFKGEYTKAVERIGLDHLLDDTFLYNKREFTGEGE